MSKESRRLSASKFFEKEEKDLTKVSTYDRVVEILNGASLMYKDSAKIAALKQVQELIIHKDANLLDNFLDEMIAFLSDKSQDVRKFVIGFTEEACKKDPEILSKVVGNLAMCLEDENVNIRKRAMIAVATLYKVGLMWIVKSKIITELMEQTWTYIVKMKDRIKDMLGNDNDGVRTHAIKFLENIVLTLSMKQPESEIPKKNENDMTLDQVPEGHSYLKFKQLEKEGLNALDAILEYQAVQHISSANLMTSMGSLTAVAKQRPQYMARVVASFEMLHVNLPPTLAKSQVSSVRKNLKMMLLILLKHPASLDFQSQITTLLTDLGATQQEVTRALPKIDEAKKRKAEEEKKAAKKAKLEEEEADLSIGMTPFVEATPKPQPPSKNDEQIAIDITAEDLSSKLSTANVADLVLLSMVMLPSNMPAHFSSTYTPISAAGTQGQIKHTARLLATQLSAAGLGKGYTEMKRKQAEKAQKEQSEKKPVRIVDYTPTPKQTISTVLSGSAVKEKKLGNIVGSMAPPTALPLPISVAQAPRKQPGVVKKFSLAHVTKPLSADLLDNMTIGAFNRMLDPNPFIQSGALTNVKMKMLASIVAQFGGPLKTMLIDYIFADLRNRSDLAFAWLYQEYVNYQGYNVATASLYKNISNYDECLTRLLTGLFQRPDQKEGLFSRLLLEAPCITENAVQVLRKYCQDETRVYLGMSTVRDLILKRPTKKFEFLNVLLDFSIHANQDVRNNAIRVIKALYDRDDLQESIEKYALNTLKHLQSSTPSTTLFKTNLGRAEVSSVWTEDLHKICLYLHLALMPSKHSLIHELADVYTEAQAEIKRTILRALENPVRGMGMQSPELLLLVENCPKGAETLVTRIIHILTDKVAPSQELVERVRDLYHKRVPDVRFLIPVLTGLTKKEVLAALPRLIKLNPQVVKEVFTRLLGTQAEASYTSPLSPDQLLIALHNIDPQKCDMKTIIKATNLCFQEKEIYTQEILAVVMQKLMEQSPLPTLLMRTVIQSLSMYPRLIGFIMNILQRLITKQVWKQKKVWEGFVKCCERTKPQSFQVLLQLPAPQLKNVFEISPGLFEPLVNHVHSFTPHQRAHIPKALLSVLENDPQKEKEKAEEQERIYQEKIEAERLKQLRLAEEKKRQDAEKMRVKTPTIPRQEPQTPSPIQVLGQTNVNIKEEPGQKANTQQGATVKTVSGEKNKTPDVSKIIKEEPVDIDADIDFSGALGEAIAAEIPDNGHEHVKVKNEEEEEKKKQARLEQKKQKELEAKRKQEREKERKEKLEKERTERENKIRERNEKLEKERLEKLERERLQQKIERERKEKKAKERKEKADKEKFEKEQKEKEKKDQIEKERIERERLAKEYIKENKLERERLELEKETMMKEKIKGIENSKSEDIEVSSSLVKEEETKKEITVENKPEEQLEVGPKDDVQLQDIISEITTVINEEKVTDNIEDNELEIPNEGTTEQETNQAEIGSDNILTGEPQLDTETSETELLIGHQGEEEITGVADQVEGTTKEEIEISTEESKFVSVMENLEEKETTVGGIQETLPHAEKETLGETGRAVTVKEEKISVQFDEEKVSDQTRVTESLTCESNPIAEKELEISVKDEITSHEEDKEVEAAVSLVTDVTGSNEAISEEKLLQVKEEDTAEAMGSTASPSKRGRGRAVRGGKRKAATSPVAATRKSTRAKKTK